jgi:hypothetical protein
LDRRRTSTGVAAVWEQWPVIVKGQRSHPVADVAEDATPTREAARLQTALSTKGTVHPRSHE